MSITKIRPIIIQHFSDGFIPVGSATAAMRLVVDAMGAIQRLSGVTAEVNRPVVYGADWPVQDTLLAERQLVRDRLGTDGTIIVAFVWGSVAGIAGTAGGWGWGQGGTGVSVLRGEGVDVRRRVDTGELPPNAADVFTYMTAHELGHCFSLQHTDPDPRAEPGRSTRLMDYSHSAFKRWLKYPHLFPRYGFSQFEIDQLRNRPYLRLEEWKANDMRLTIEQMIEVARPFFDDLGAIAVATIAAIGMAESGGDVGAIGDNYLSGHQTEDSPYRWDRGPWQINSAWQFDIEKLLNDPAYSAEKAREIYELQGFGAWATFNGDYHLRFMSEARSAANVGFDIGPDFSGLTMSRELTYNQALKMVTDAYFQQYNPNEFSDFRPVQQLLGDWPLEGQEGRRGGQPWDAWILSRKTRNV